MRHKPLAFGMQPKSIDQVIGQKHLLDKGKPLYEMLTKGRLSSIILYGIPGIGKTSIASAIAGTAKLTFRKLNAVTDNKKDLEAVVAEAKMIRSTIVLCVDELHRFTKTQIEFLLPYIESGLLVLIGLTSENPYHNINPAIRSRCLIFELTSLSEQDIRFGLQRALDDKENGFGNLDIEIEEEALGALANSSGGDMRTALNNLELTYLISSDIDSGAAKIKFDDVKNAVQRNNLHIDKDGDGHFNTLSAFHKSMRGGDVDASLLYLALLLEAGDLKGIYRRIIAVTYEDVGLAQSLGERVMAGINAAEMVGLKEARIPLSNLVIDLCLSPKSNHALKAIDRAIAIVRSGRKINIPNNLKDAHYKGAKELGNGINYKYPHDYPIGKFGGWVAQQYLPDDLKNIRFYKPDEIGEEERLKKLNDKFKSEQSKIINKNQN
ncbi:replication-associated recombination protein A [Sporosarcina sp. G11-34]|uniref:replication-associated recombination protein A n=1 Tax=Sporosarcina sp. G11-34 TaxID=2849605 RepID=UPI0022A977AE|nr:replication-associated recombination protein A [Sporosarcina sp. G11-34]MCZ2259413.1 replication-associated recombination protein A [Sporosarcina sp. G11-34]